MKKLVSLFLSNFCLLLSYSQHLYTEKYKECSLTSFCLDCGDAKAQPPKSLVDELASNLDKKSLSNISGIIEVQILIDESGKPCLLSSVNEANISSKKLGLQKAINNTSAWEPAVSDNKK